MAQIVFGAAASHSPQLSTPAAQWQLHRDRDRVNKNLYFRGQPFEFDALVEARRAEGIPDRISEAVWGEQYDRCERSMAELGARLGTAEPDVMIIVGDDQRELFLDDGMPALGLFTGESLRSDGKSEEELPESLRAARWANWGERAEQLACDAKLSGHLVDQLNLEGFDVTLVKEQPAGRSLGHAFVFVRNRLMGERTYPIVPIFLNTYFPPNQPTAGRCYRLGQAVRRAVESWPSDVRVAIAASGGLSHFVIDEAFDRRVIEALQTKDANALAAIPQEDLMSGTSETRNWIVLAGAAEHLTPQVVDYVPTYRSEAGTGCGMAFAHWS